MGQRISYISCLVLRSLNGENLGGFDVCSSDNQLYFRCCTNDEKHTAGDELFSDDDEGGGSEVFLGRTDKKC